MQPRDLNSKERQAFPKKKLARNLLNSSRANSLEARDIREANNLCSMSLCRVRVQEGVGAGQKTYESPFGGTSAAAGDRQSEGLFSLMKQQPKDTKGETTNPISPRIQTKIHCL